MAAGAKREDDPFGMFEGVEPVEETEQDATDEVAGEDVEGEGDSEPLGDDAEPDSDAEAEAESPPQPQGADSDGDAEGDADEDPGETEPSTPQGQAEEAPDELALERERRMKAQKAAARYRQELAALRQGQAQNPAQYAPAQPPVNPATGQPVAQPPAPSGDPGYPVQVGQDGTSVYVPREQIEGDVRQVAAQIAAEQMETFRSQQTQAMESTFVMQDPESHRAVVDEAREVDQFVGLACQAAAANGTLYIDPQRAAADPHGALIDAMSAAGIVEQVNDLFPTVGAHFDSFFRAWASQDPFAKLQVYGTIAGGRRRETAQETSEREPALEVQRKPGRVVERVVDTPPSHARRGSGRSDNSADDEREFQRLYKTMISSPGKLSKSQLSRLNELGVTLGKDGFDEDLAED